jgi:hypothetical protein
MYSSLYIVQQMQPLWQNNTKFHVVPKTKEIGEMLNFYFIQIFCYQYENNLSTYEIMHND